VPADVMRIRAKRSFLSFIGGRRWLRRSATQAYGMGAGYGGVHGQVQRQREWTGGGTVGAAWPRRVRHVTQGEWGRKAVRRKGVPQRTDRRTKAGLGVRAQQSRGVATRDAGTRSGA
jgi:hypothetical protein